MPGKGQSLRTVFLKLRETGRPQNQKMTSKKEKNSRT
jgi:hypothetical protein